MHRTHGTRAWVWAVVFALGCVCVHADVCVRGNVAVGNGNYACDIQHVRVTMASMVAAQRADVQLVVNSALHNVRAVVPCVTEYRSEWRVCMGDPVAVGFRFRTGAYVPYVDSLAPGWIRRVLRVSYLLDLVDVWKADTVIDVQTDLWRIDHNISAATRRVPPGYGHLWNTTVDDIRLCKDPALSWPVYVVRDQNEMAALVDVRGENATDLECHVVFAFGGADVRDAEPQRKYAATVPTVAYVLGYQPAVVAWRPVLLTELVHLPFIVAVGCVRAFQIGASALAVCVLPVWRVHVCLLLLYGQCVMCAYTDASYRVRFFVALASVCGVADGYVILGGAVFAVCEFRALSLVGSVVCACYARQSATWGSGVNADNGCSCVAYPEYASHSDVVGGCSHMLYVRVPAACGPCRHCGVRGVAYVSRA